VQKSGFEAYRAIILAIPHGEGGGGKECQTDYKMVPAKYYTHMHIAKTGVQKLHTRMNIGDLKEGKPGESCRKLYISMREREKLKLS
jgi:hypothetical protein